MIPTAATIWSVPVYLPYLQPALTPEITAAAERKLGVKLPKSYLDILAYQNGGAVRYTLPETVHSEIWGIGPNSPSITRDQTWRESDEDDDIWLPGNPEALIPFDGDGHWYLCFDYRVSGLEGEPSVTYLDLECEQEKSVARDFDAFLAKLKPQSSDMIGIKGDWTLDGAAEILQSALGKPFQNQGSSANGYPVYRFDMSPDEDTPEWVWLSPNEAPRGFVRPDHRHYAQLRNMLPGTALRFPKWADVKILVTATEGVVDQVREVCEQSPFTIIEMKASG